MPRLRGVVFPVLLGALVLVSAPAHAGPSTASAHAVPDGTFALEITGGTLVMQARGARLEAVIAAIERTGNLSVHRAAPLTGKISVRLRGVPLELGLQRLLSGADLVLIYERMPSPPGTTAGVKLAEVRVYARGERDPRSPVEHAGAVGRPTADRLTPAARRPIAQGLTAPPDGLVLTNDSALEGTRAAGAEARVGNHEAVVTALADAMEDEDPGVRERAVEALGKTWSERGVEPLAHAMLADRDASVREAAARALGRTWSDAAVAPLSHVVLTASSRAVREAAALALAEIGAAAAVPFLVRALDDPRGSVRERAAVALGAMGTEDALPALERVALDDPDEWASEAASAALTALTVRDPGTRKTGPPASGVRASRSSGAPSPPRGP